MASTGNRIQTVREARRMSREELAKKLGTTRMTVWRVENGKVQVPADELRYWARALKTSVSRLVA
jgi:transcriptional regulator with XRE-family HTH domain